MKLLGTTIYIILGCWIASYVSHANADIWQAQEASSQSCVSISGMYQFFGQDEDDKLRRRTLTEVLVGPLLLSGKGTATELSYDSANNLLHIRIRRENLPPDPDFFVKVECLNGMLVFENSKSGHADGSTYEVESKFRFSKDSVGDLIVHEVYSVKSTNLGFFWKKRNGEAVTRFHPLQD